MRLWTRSLYTRLTAVMIGLFVVLTIAYLVLAYWSNNRYYQEVTQHLNASLGMYIANRAPLIASGEVNHKAMRELGELVMVVNPIVEVYLTDTRGDILAHSLPDDKLVRTRIDLAPVHHWLAEDGPLPITSTDPRSATGQRIFSAWPVEDESGIQGYLYVILGGQDYQSLQDSLSGSYIFRLSLGALAIIIFFAILSASIIFAFLTRPLRRLAGEMKAFQEKELKYLALESETGDEIEFLRSTFSAMKARIREQLENLKETDRVRRELISNVSHDLRTPLASMQGYLETLSRGELTLSQKSRQLYTAVAFKHCRRLSKLVQELFELSKLDAGYTRPQKEDFSLTELLQDIVQKFELNAQQKNLALVIEMEERLCMVHADIGLIERVLENLIDNAISHTPPGGTVTISVSTVPANKVYVQVRDTGVGMNQDELPRIFDRYFQGARYPETSGKNRGRGLGLAIVKKILDLHSSGVHVTSSPGAGSCFGFSLPSS